MRSLILVTVQFDVGVTNSPIGRLNEHRRMYGGNERKNAWLRELVDAHMLPLMYTLELLEIEGIWRDRHVPPALRLGAWSRGDFCSSLQAPDMTRLRYFIQPGYNQSGSTSLTGEIGTSGCEASPDRYGIALNRQTGFESVCCTLNRWISLSRPTLRHLAMVGVEPFLIKNGSPQGETSTGYPEHVRSSPS